MAYVLLSLSNLTELKLRSGSANSTMATILGIDYPTVEAYSVYVWDNTSTATPDDYEIVCPTSKIGLAGRWYRVELDVPPHTHEINQINGLQAELDDKLEIESDPTVPSHVKAISTDLIGDWNQAFSWGDHAGLYKDINYIPTWEEIENKPELFSGDYNDLENKPELFNGDYESLDNKPSLFSGSYEDLSDKPTLFDGNYSSLAGKPTLFSGNYNDLTNKPTILQADWNQTNTSAQDFIKNKPSIPSTARTFNNNVSRTLNSNFGISPTQDAIVTYSISLSVTNPLLAGASTANVFLEYSADGGTNWITVSSITNASSVGLAVSVALTQPCKYTIQGVIPKNTLTRLRTTTTGTATISYGSGQEVLLP